MEKYEATFTAQDPPAEVDVLLYKDALKRAMELVAVLEIHKADLVAALEALREELTDGVCCDACHTDRGHISDCPVPVAERILARARGEPAGTKEEGR